METYNVIPYLVKLKQLDVFIYFAQGLDLATSLIFTFWLFNSLWFVQLFLYANIGIAAAGIYFYYSQKFSNYYFQNYSKIKYAFIGILVFCYLLTMLLQDYLYIDFIIIGFLL